MKDDTGSIHVIEALLAGTIILTAMLFLTSASSPSPAAAESGLDLAVHASDNLIVLQDDVPEDPDTYPHRLAEIIATVLSGNDTAAQATAAADAEAQLEETVGIGNRYLLRLDNGYTQITLLPVEQGFKTEPRAAKAAERFHVPAFQALAGDDPWQCDSASNLASADIFYPGSDETIGGTTFNVALGDELISPTGHEYGPGGQDWDDWWIEEQGSISEGDSGPNKIPYSALYGWWKHEGTCKYVGLDADTATDHASYGIQLVVWPIAG